MSDFVWSSGVEYLPTRRGDRKPDRVTMMVDITSVLGMDVAMYRIDRLGLECPGSAYDTSIIGERTRPFGGRRRGAGRRRGSSTRRETSRLCDCLGNMHSGPVLKDE